MDTSIMKSQGISHCLDTGQPVTLNNLSCTSPDNLSALQCKQLICLAFLQ